MSPKWVVMIHPVIESTDAMIPTWVSQRTDHRRQVRPKSFQAFTIREAPSFPKSGIELNLALPIMYVGVEHRCSKSHPRLDIRP